MVCFLMIIYLLDAVQMYRVICCYLILYSISPFGYIRTYTFGTIISCFLASFSFLKKVSGIQTFDGSVSVR